MNKGRTQKPGPVDAVRYTLIRAPALLLLSDGVPKRLAQRGVHLRIGDKVGVLIDEEVSRYAVERLLGRQTCLV